jgi:hypothetical protein
MVEGAMTTPARHVVPAKSEREQRHEDALAEQENSGGDEAKMPRPVNAPPICEFPTCRTALRANNLSGLCQRHRNKVSSRERKDLVPEVVRAAGTARNALAGDVERVCEVDGCGKVLGKHTKGTKCVPCLKRIKPGGGWEKCEKYPQCPRLTQRLKGALCALCRRGKKWHLVAPDGASTDGEKQGAAKNRAAKELKMARKFCACGKEIRKRRDGETEEKCCRCRSKTANATKSARRCQR